MIIILQKLQRVLEKIKVSELHFQYFLSSYAETKLSLYSIASLSTHFLTIHSEMTLPVIPNGARRSVRKINKNQISIGNLIIQAFSFKIVCQDTCIDEKSLSHAVTLLFKIAQNCSMGYRSGESGGKNNTYPASAQNERVPYPSQSQEDQIKLDMVLYIKVS